MNVTNRVNDIERKLLKSEDFVEESNVIVSDRDRELVEAIRWECISRGHKVGYARNPVTFDYDFNTIVVTHTKNKFMSVAERLAYKRYVKLWDKNRDIMEQTLRSVMKEFDSTLESNVRVKLTHCDTERISMILSYLESYGFTVNYVYNDFNKVIGLNVFLPQYKN